MLTLTLLGPGTPMLFQGQEFASSRPFLYFADHGDRLAELVRSGRLEFLQQFPSLATPECQEIVADPGDLATFERCKLDWTELHTHREDHAFVSDLIALRRKDPAFSAQDRAAMDGSVLSRAAFLLRFFAASGDRLLLVNLGHDLDLHPAADPLLAPPAHGPWTLYFSSEDPRYHGLGTPPVVTERGWHLPARSAVVLAAATQ
jgi:maltooligosyltrehalose trehalohydrolase